MGLRVPGYSWIGSSTTGGNSYVNNGQKPKILLHMTVSYSLSMGYAQSHPYPPQTWANPYNGDKWQSIELDRAGLALYQPPYTNSYLNRNWYISQTELVGYPEVNVRTYSDQQCKWIGESVIAPIWQAFQSHGINVDLNNVKYHSNSSGSASEYWAGRMSDDEWWNFNGICCHIDAVGNDHWDCSVEDTLAMAKYARAFLGQGGGVVPPTEEDDDLMQLVWADPKQGGSNTLYVVDGQCNAWAMTDPATVGVLQALKLVKPGQWNVSPQTIYRYLHYRGYYESGKAYPAFVTAPSCPEGVK